MEKAITVYCASAANLPETYIAAARSLGEAMARRGVRLITGAGRTGLMGTVADAALACGGKVTGIIPRFMVERGWHHNGLSELKVVETMHERKAAMASMSCAAIALPGGIGTLEELTEIMTWRQLGLFNGNVVIYNAGNYYAPLVSMLKKAIDDGFMCADHKALYAIAESAEEALDLALADSSVHFSPKF